MPLTRTSSPTPHSGLTAVAVVLLVAAGAIWCSQTVRKADRSSGNDLVGYLEASRALYAGADPYHLPDRFPYIYPLFLAAVIRPLADVPAAAASIAWFGLQAAALGFVLRTASAHPRMTASTRLVLAAAIVAVFGDVLQNEFLNGQVNVIVLAFAVAAIHLTGGRPRIAALLLGAAIAIKLTPALFLLYWLIERRYRLVLESALWAAVLMVSPWLVVQDRLWPLYGGYVRAFILARAASADAHEQAIFFTPYGFWAWLTGFAPGRAAVVASALAVLAVLTFWHWRRAVPALSEPARADVGGSKAWIYAAATPLVSPMSEVHHLTSLIPSAAIGACALWQRRGGPLVSALMALFTVLIWIARFQRTGPWYFLSILSLIAAAGLALNRTGEAPDQR